MSEPGIRRKMDGYLEDIRARDHGTHGGNWTDTSKMSEPGITVWSLSLGLHLRGSVTKCIAVELSWMFRVIGSQTKGTEKVASTRASS